MKAIISKCNNNMWWYRHNIGEVVDINDSYYIRDELSRRFLLWDSKESPLLQLPSSNIFRVIEKDDAQLFINIDDIKILRENNLNTLLSGF